MPSGESIVNTVISPSNHPFAKSESVPVAPPRASDVKSVIATSKAALKLIPKSENSASNSTESTALPLGKTREQLKSQPNYIRP